MQLAPGLDRELDWLKQRDPWAILVREVMLQQTSIARVQPAWERFLQQFPTPRACADASLGDVIRAWDGLGYHLRARNLHRAAREITEQHAGLVPSSVEELRELPGVGPYTSRAVASFAFGVSVAVVDTNVGRILARCVANRPLRASEAQALADELLGLSSPAVFNQAMLDLGAAHCRSVPQCATCPVRGLCAWRKSGGPDPAAGSAGVSRPQGAFDGSDRQSRGRLIGELRRGHLSSKVALDTLDGADPRRARRLLDSLAADGLVRERSRRVSLVGD